MPSSDEISLTTTVCVLSHNQTNQTNFSSKMSSLCTTSLFFNDVLLSSYELKETQLRITCKIFCFIYLFIFFFLSDIFLTRM
ncbi:hypothetical protein GJAV_G00223700 [Gymnothorax javanicus]|nr:hypothetical protein GJAV_G00223700 [Gymnothorax javanicus]